jgi:phosphoglucomutase
MDNLYDEFGYYFNTVSSYTFEGSVGMEKMANIMETLRATAPSSFADMDVVKVDDYKTSTSIDVANGDTNVIELPKSNVLAYTLTGGNKIIVRPSGTEPKIKAYITAIGKDRAEAQVIADKLLAEADELMK